MMGLDDHVNDCISMFILGMCMIPCLPIWCNLVLGTGLCSIWVISTHDSSFCSNRSYMHIEFACSHFRSMNTCFLWFSQCRWVMHMVLDMLTLAQAQFCVSLCNQPWLFLRHKHTGHIDMCCFPRHLLYVHLLPIKCFAYSRSVGTYSHCPVVLQ